MSQTPKRTSTNQTIALEPDYEGRQSLRTKLTEYLLAALLGVALTTSLHAQSSSFTYQGQLTDNGSPASGIYDLRFSIYDADTGGTEVAGPVTNSPVAVSNGLFTVWLDFGPGVFDGSDRWLEIGVATNDSGVFNNLSPRQPLTATPYAIQAANAASAVAVSGTVAASQLTGTLSSNNIGAGTRWPPADRPDSSRLSSRSLGEG